MPEETRRNPIFVEATPNTPETRGNLASAAPRRRTMNSASRPDRRVSPNNFAIFTANNGPSIASGRYVNYSGRLIFIRRCGGASLAINIPIIVPINVTGSATDYRPRVIAALSLGPLFFSARSRNISTIALIRKVSDPTEALLSPRDCRRATVIGPQAVVRHPIDFSQIGVRGWLLYYHHGHPDCPE